MNIQQNSQVSFNGNLYGRMGNHVTKSILCCPHGDSKFVKFIAELGKTKPDSLKISTSNQGLYKIIIETDQVPHLNPFEKIFYRLSKLQTKALNLRNEGKISSLIFQLNELEYRNLRDNYLYISTKTLDKFANTIRKNLPKEMKPFLDEFFKGK